VSQVFEWVDDISHQLLHLFGLRKPPFCLAIKQLLAIDADGECATGLGRDEGHLINLPLE